MDHAKSKLAMAEHHVRRYEERVAHQTALVEELETQAGPDAAKQAKRLLETLEITLILARNHLQLERNAHGKKR